MAVEGSNVMVTAIKKAYGSDSLIVRVLNYSGKEEDAAITLTFPGKEVAAVYAADLDEHRTGEITATAAMQEIGVKPNTFYRRVKELHL